MEVFDDPTEAFPRILQAPASLMSQQIGDQELGGRILPQCEEELGTSRSTQKQPEEHLALSPESRHRKAFAPIDLLPPELLGTIFTLAVDHEPDTVRFINGTLMLVCRYWNQLANDTPSLWAKVRKTAETSNASVIHALEKSKDSPLEIIYNVGQQFIPEEDETTFFSAIYPHAHRWRRATLWLRGKPQELEPMTTLSAPLLESLLLSVNHFLERARDKPLDIFGGQPPASLRELSLVGIAVQWSPTTLCNLKALEISNIRRLGPSLDQLYAILPASPSLESLSIRDVIFSDDAGTLPPNPTHMPALRKLWLQHTPTKITKGLLAAIHAPKCKFGALDAKIQGDPFETFFTPDVSRFFDHMRSGINASSIESTHHIVEISWEGPWNITLRVDNIRVARRVLDWLSVSPEPTSPSVPLRLEIFQKDPRLVEDILTVMSDIEVLHRLIFSFDTPVASALRMLTPGGSVGGPRELFPALEDVQIKIFMNDDEWEHLLRMLHRRQGEIEARVGGQHLKPLRRLSFGVDWKEEDEDEEKMITEFRLTMWPNRLEEVRRLLGSEGELVWYRWSVTEDGALEDSHRC